MSAADGAAEGGTRLAAAALLRAAARGEAGGVPHLVVREAGAPPRQVALCGELTVGRGPAAALRLADGGVSRLHARFLVGPEGSVTVEDLGSKNGLRRGGRPLGRGPCALAPGDVVGLGETTLVLVDPMEGAEAATAPAAVADRVGADGEDAGDDGSGVHATAGGRAPGSPGLLVAAAGLLALAGVLVALG